MTWTVCSWTQEEVNHLLSKEGSSTLVESSSAGQSYHFVSTIVSRALQCELSLAVVRFGLWLLHRKEMENAF